MRPFQSIGRSILVALALLTVLPVGRSQEAERVRREHDDKGGDYRLGKGESGVTIVGRATWGAGPVATTPDSGGSPRSWEHYDRSRSLSKQLNAITIHHTANSGRLGKGGMRALQRMHQGVGHERADVGYHFVIDTDGAIYEGRPIGVKGSHTKGANTGNIGIALQGDFESRVQNLWLPDTPTAAQLSSLKKLVKALRRSHLIPKKNIKGHNERLPGHTECPGDNMEREVASLRRGA